MTGKKERKMARRGTCVRGVLFRSEEQFQSCCFETLNARSGGASLSLSLPGRIQQDRKTRIPLDWDGMAWDGMGCGGAEEVK